MLEGLGQCMGTRLRSGLADRNVIVQVRNKVLAHGLLN